MCYYTMQLVSLWMWLTLLGSTLGSKCFNHWEVSPYQVFILYIVLLCLCHTTCILCVVPSEAEGEKLEKELNGKGPGEAYFIKCDVTKEEDIKVSLLSRVPPIWSYFLKP